MNDFAAELKELIDRHDGLTPREEVVNALIDALEELDPSDDDD